MTHDFTSDWFSHNIPTWQGLLPGRGITKVLEVGSHEGRSALWLVENILPKKGWKDLICVDVWEDTEILTRFINNTTNYHDRIDIRRDRSVKILTLMIHYREKFDLIYVDGSHSASDVLTDLCLAFEVLKPGGLMICDDYLGGEWGNPLDQPKAAIDAFVNCNMRRLHVLPVSGYQAFIEKRL